MKTRHRVVALSRWASPAGSRQPTPGTSDIRYPLQVQMKTKIVIPLAAVLSAVLMAADSQAAVSRQQAISAALKARIGQMQRQERFVCRGDLICGVSDLPLFYRRNGYRPVWLGEQNFTQRIDELLAAIGASRQDGLRPGDYHLQAIADILQLLPGSNGWKAPFDVATLVDLELLCTDAYLLLGSHLLAGRVNPETLYAKWLVDDPEADLARILQKAADSERIGESLRQLGPPHSGYTALKNQLARYRRMASAYRWTPIPPGRLIRIGDRDARVPAIRQRLQLLGDLPDSATRWWNLYDIALSEAVLRFQMRHGLKADGIVGEQTLAALNVTPDRLIARIELNLERWRWIPHTLGRRHLLVNAADYSLTVVEDDQPVMRMRVVVGNSYRKTPVFSDRLERIEINPYWNVPTRLAIEDLLPRIQKDPDYLARNDFSVFAGWKKGARQLDPARIDWSQVTADNFWYRLRQNPGPKNTLGRIKFLFPNRFAVYLHDTPSRRQFDREIRGFSSGCIRVERPIDLAQYLLRDDKRWDRQKILDAVDSKKRTKVRLRGDVHIHLMYWTAWVDREGKLQFRDDIYQRDEPLADALRETSPRSVLVGRTRRSPVAN